MLTISIILLGRQYYILYEPNHHFLNFQCVLFLPFRNQRTMSHVEKVLILWFCQVHDVMFHSFLFFQSTTSWWVSSKCSNFTMQLVRIQEGENFGWDVNCSWATCILLASKGKGHNLVEMVCVWWLPWMLCDKHTKSCVSKCSSQWVLFSFTNFLSNEWMTLLVDYGCPLLYE
jgi:hypothetical protein